jgi:nanoRNase/pAp phosphatase (c-di-AMP/oligoRNAs hydrolase)
MAPNNFRLVTRSDFDGLVCGMLLRELNMIDEIKFVHPKDMQDGIVPITARDIITNLPYAAGCHLAFDHHASETLRMGEHSPSNHIIDASAPSAARVVYAHFGGRAAFPRVQPDLMLAVDQADSARFSLDDILEPCDWVLLNFLMDSRTGLGRFRDFRISNYELMMHLIEHCRDHTITQVLQLPDVVERIQLFHAHRERFEDQIRRCTKVSGRLATLDLRAEETIYAGNRFMIYALFPQCDISVHVLWGVRKENTVFAIGKSIIDRGSAVNVGEVCLGYGGGGHEAAGTCQVPNSEAERVKLELIPILSPAPTPLRDAA